MTARRWSAVLLPIVVIASTRCSVDENVDDQVWSCSTDEQCGTQDGKPMVCWQNYCMPSCDMNAPSEPDALCVKPGALLRRCQPESEESQCRKGLSCYRSKLFENVGLCVPMPVCTVDDDCRDKAKNTCATSLLTAIAPLFASAGAQVFGNLQCVQSPCKQRLSGCPSTEACLNEIYSLPLEFPEMCVPKCDGRDVCPPTFACARVNGAEGAMRVCVPGVVGVRCERAEDCILGDCVETGAGFSVCSPPCSRDSDCLRFSGSVPAWCVPGPTRRMCVAASPFQGSACNVQLDGADCPDENQFCTEVSPYGAQKQGECRRRCDPDGSCPAYGGLAHVCLSAIDGGCYPGLPGMPCKDTSECIKPLECLDVELDGRETHPFTRICTMACSTHEDCDGGLAPVMRGAYCGSGGLCKLRAQPDQPCEVPEHCSQERCVAGFCREKDE